MKYENNTLYFYEINIQHKVSKRIQHKVQFKIIDVSPANICNDKNIIRMWVFYNYPSSNLYFGAFMMLSLDYMENMWILCVIHAL